MNRERRTDSTSATGGRQTTGPARLTRGVAGWTLLELLVVTVILVVLIGLMLPAFSHLKSGGDRTRCLANLRQLHQVLMAATTDRHGVFPEYNPRNVPADTPYGSMAELNTWPWFLYFQHYIADWKLFRCPAAPKEWGASGLYSHYAYNGWLSPPDPPGTPWAGRHWGNLFKIQQPASVIMLIDGAYPNGTQPTSGYYFFSDPNTTAHPRHHGGLHALFVDGHVSFRREGELDFDGHYMNPSP